ncbi:helix-turn-helix transcriptional regulator [Dictyobacter alpinus]|uniref:Helix-turn-helix transcriptional regulator n=1 Tax=Dictyobacter alpinus TaxID=2014873 RepID=A0A402B637_9CHLR|nr:LuxR C-terminal-related transcriptional regulator [Dictyobacter alpinus]GCE26821.1 helix-turn-helix transcriptional regulator [Dictyobacter alpinus]
MEIEFSKQLLLATKLTIPHNYASLIIPRTRLYHKLERGIHHPLTLISAPAGFGKTTLLNAWLQAYPTNVAWLSLSKEDDDLTRFWCYCLAAFAQVDSQLVEEAQSLLNAATAIEVVLAALINALVSYDQELLLILDDYQALQLPAIHRSVTFLVEHLPAHAHLFISARVDPPLPLVRLRVRGQLSEIRSADLRFTLEESREFLIHGMQLQLQPAELTTLMQDTEGWIAGIQLTALSLQSNRPLSITKSNGLAPSIGINRYVSHYLTEEVLTTVPEDVQDFLFLTSILTSLQVDLCNAVTGQNNGQQMLDWLEQANLFISPVGEDGIWHRYHQPLAELLRQGLSKKFPERINALHLHASDWYTQENMLHEAIEHALAGQAFELAADLLEMHSWPLWTRGQMPLLLDWLTQIQGHIDLEQRPVIAYFFAFMYLHTGKCELYERALKIVQRNWQETHCAELQADILDLQAYHAICQGDSSRALQYTQQALEICQNNPLLGSLTHVLHGAAQLQCGDLQQAQLQLILGWRAGIQVNRMLVVTSALFYQGHIKLLQGHLGDARELYQQCISSCGDGMVWLNIQAHLQLGQLYLEWNELLQAEEHLGKAIVLSQRLGEDALTLIESHILAARLAWIQNKPEQALLLLDQAESRAHQSDGQRCERASIAVVRIHYWLMQNSNDFAEQWSEQNCPADLSTRSLLEQECWCLVRARLLLARKRPDEAIKMLVELLPAIRAQDRLANELQVQMLLVQAYALLGDTRHTKLTLEQLLLHAEPGGYRRLFLDEGPVVMALLADVYQRQQKRYSGELPPHVLSYIHALLLDFGCDIEPRDWCSWQKRAQRAQASLEQLSEREFEVLKLIAQGYSNQEIARSLVVAESTIKTHLNNIYSKLNVNSRLQALTKAHAVGLLDV